MPWPIRPDRVAASATLVQNADPRGKTMRFQWQTTPMQMDPQLLGSATSSAYPVDLNSCLNAHGLYNPVQCVLRLSPEVHRRLAELPDGVTSFDEVQFEGLQAF